MYATLKYVPYRGKIKFHGRNSPIIFNSLKTLREFSEDGIFEKQLKKQKNYRSHCKRKKFLVIAPKCSNFYSRFFQLVYLWINLFQSFIIFSPEIFSTCFICYFLFFLGQMDLRINASVHSKWFFRDTGRNHSSPNMPLFNCCNICVLYSPGTSKEILCGLPP